MYPCKLCGQAAAREIGTGKYYCPSEGCPISPDAALTADQWQTLMAAQVQQAAMPDDRAQRVKDLEWRIKEIEDNGGTAPDHLFDQIEAIERDLELNPAAQGKAAAQPQTREGGDVRQGVPEVWPEEVLISMDNALRKATDIQRKGHYETLMAVGAAAIRGLYPTIIAAQPAPSVLREALEVVSKAKALKNFLFKSLNAGPMTTGPSQEAKVLRELYAALDGFDALAQVQQAAIPDALHEARIEGAKLALEAAANTVWDTCTLQAKPDSEYEQGMHEYGRKSWQGIRSLSPEDIIKGGAE